MPIDKHRLKQTAAIVTAVTALLTASACGGIEDKATIDKMYSTEAVDLTQIRSVDGVTCHIPDDYLSSGKADANDNSKYILSNKEFIVYCGTTGDFNIAANIDDNNKLSNMFSDITDYDIKVKKVRNDDTSNFKASCTVEIDKSVLQGYIRSIRTENGRAIIFAANEKNNDTPETIVDSLESSTSEIQEVTISDGDLQATINGIAVGSSFTPDSVKNDLVKMGESFESIKSELSNVNTATISDFSDQVSMKVQSISEQADGAEELYLQSVSAYNEAVENYEIALSNGIDLNSKEEEIEKAFGIDIEPEWTKYVIVNEDSNSAIKRITIEYDNMIKAIQIEGKDNEMNGAVTPDTLPSIELNTQTDSSVTERLDNAVTELFTDSSTSSGE